MYFFTVCDFVGQTEPRSGQVTLDVVTVCLQCVSASFTAVVNLPFILI